MLTARASRLREWALFALAAVAPALAVGGLGLRALQNEEAAILGETARALDASAERTAATIERTMAAAAAGIDAGLDADPARADATLRRLCPAFAEPLVIGGDRALLVPPAPPALQQAPAQCRELMQDLARDPAARAPFLDACAEARSATGRWLWPVVALSDRGAVPADRLVSWLDAHAPLLSGAERDATRLEVEAALEGPLRHRASQLLSAGGSRREELRAELADEGAAAALRRPADAAGLVHWRAGATAATLRALDDARLAGCIVHRRSLAQALNALGLPPDQRARVVTAAELRAHDRPRAHGGGARSRDDEPLGATVAVAPDLGLRIVPADPASVARRASRSRVLLGALGGAATLLAFGVAGLLFARMRAARRSSELRTDFVSAVSHELRTPIASVRMLAELLEQGRVEPAEQREVHEALAREARRLGETVDRLLGFSRMAAGRYVVDRVDAPVADAVAACIDTFEERHPEAAPVERALDTEATAAVDAGQLALAVDNLLANALKYAPEGKPYRVSVARRAGSIEIRVSDRGPGIARSDQRRIFEPFERVDDRLSRATEGSGIGLSLVRHVARAHDGEVSIESEPGRGATFVMRLPSHVDDARTP
jgi:two-component system phosphate regulon sensor histidine kinase PhoR